MKIFVGSNTINIKKKSQVSKKKQFDVEYNSIFEENITSIKEKNICIRNVKNKEVYTFITLLLKKDNISDSIFTLEVDKKIKIIRTMQKKKSYIKAAGGIVRKNNCILCIYRLGKWDLPKGKVEKKETLKETAIREVEEECSIRVQNPQKLCTTFHIYTIQQKIILKKTKWYVMDLLDDANMKPQESENIECIRWIDNMNIEKTMDTSYNSIQLVIEKYKNWKK
ncbi:MAG: NUDIX domain-containing protein [Chitinophagaceae bacterium]|nr:NUDIX domain-containing protein [Chitinophagaceae bacterium]